MLAVCIAGVCSETIDRADDRPNAPSYLSKRAQSSIATRNGNSIFSAAGTKSDRAPDVLISRRAMYARR